MIKKLRLVRIAQGYPAYKFVAMIGIHPNLLREVELGLREPTEKVMLKSCDILKRPPSELFTDAEEALVR